jgi:hypothetical protein
LSHPPSRGLVSAGLTSLTWGRRCFVPSDLAELLRGSLAHERPEVGVKG